MDDIHNYIHIQGNKIPPANGKILLAEPLLKDVSFSRAVVYLVNYDTNGSAFGLVLNRKSDYLLSDLVPELYKVKVPIYWGGPVDSKIIFYLHTLGEQIPNSYPISDNVYCGGDWSLVQNYLKNNTLNESNFKVFIGSSGWSKGQLDKELKINSWAVTDIDTQTLFQSQTHNLWNTSVLHLGKEYQNWINLPKNAELN